VNDLRWVLMLVGAVVVLAIYFSSRFESEDWTRERKQFAKDKTARSGKKSRRKKTSSKAPSVVAREIVKKEPRMDTVEPMAANVIAENPAVSEPDMSELVIDMSAQDDVESEVAELKTVPIEDNTSFEKVSIKKALVEETSPHVEIDSAKPIEKTDEGLLPVEEPIEPGIEDEITEVTIPVDLAVAEAEIHIAGIVADEEQAQADIPLDIEPLVLSVIVLADEEETFSGIDVREALETEGLSHGEMSIFHFHDPNKKAVLNTDDAVFSVANLLEPGIFDLDKLEELSTPGLMLFCQLPGPLAGEAALELMLDKGRGLAVRLNGHMCDDKRNPFTTQAKNYYLDRIATFNHELQVAQKKKSLGQG